MCSSSRNLFEETETLENIFDMLAHLTPRGSTRLPAIKSWSALCFRAKSRPYQWAIVKCHVQCPRKLGKCQGPPLRLSYEAVELAWKMPQFVCIMLATSNRYCQRYGQGFMALPACRCRTKPKMPQNIYHISCIFTYTFSHFSRAFLSLSLPVSLRHYRSLPLGQPLSLASS